MRCLACGEKMEVVKIESHETLSEIAYHIFICTACGDTERRLLPRRSISTADILRSVKVVQPPTPMPEDMADQRSESGLRSTASPDVHQEPGATPTRWPRISELMKDPKQFIDVFVRTRQRKD